MNRVNLSALNSFKYIKNTALSNLTLDFTLIQLRKSPEP